MNINTTFEQLFALADCQAKAYVNDKMGKMFHTPFIYRDKQYILTFICVHQDQIYPCLWIETEKNGWRSESRKDINSDAIIAYGIENISIPESNISGRFAWFRIKEERKSEEDLQYFLKNLDELYTFTTTPDELLFDPVEDIW